MTCCVVFVWCDLWVSVCLLWWFGLGRLLLGVLVVLRAVFWFCGWIGWCVWGWCFVSDASCCLSLADVVLRSGLVAVLIC